MGDKDTKLNLGKEPVNEDSYDEYENEAPHIEEFDLKDVKDKLKTIFSAERMENAEWMKNRKQKKTKSNNSEEISEFIEDGFDIEEVGNNGYDKILDFIKSVILSPWILLVETIPVKLLILGREEILKTVTYSIVMAVIYVIYSLAINIFTRDQIELAGDYTSLLTSIGALAVLVAFYFFIRNSKAQVLENQLQFDGEEVTEDVSPEVTSMVDRLNNKVNSKKSKEIRLLSKEEILNLADTKVINGDEEALNNENNVMTSLSDLLIKSKLQETEPDEKFEVTEEIKEVVEGLMDFSDLIGSISEEE